MKAVGALVAGIAAGEIRLAGRRIDNLPYDVMRTVRGREIAWVADPLDALAEKYFSLPCSVMTPNDRRLESSG